MDWRYAAWQLELLAAPDSLFDFGPSCLPARLSFGDTLFHALNETFDSFDDLLDQLFQSALFRCLHPFLRSLGTALFGTLFRRDLLLRTFLLGHVDPPLGNDGAS